MLIIKTIKLANNQIIYPHTHFRLLTSVVRENVKNLPGQTPRSLILSLSIGKYILLSATAPVTP
jgi:hypothetical protein